MCQNESTYWVKNALKLLYSIASRLIQQALSKGLERGGFPNPVKRKRHSHSQAQSGNVFFGLPISLKYLDINSVRCTKKCYSSRHID